MDAMMRERENSSPLGLYTIGIAALFLLGFLLLIVFGAQVYSDAVSGQDRNHETRALRAYLVTAAQPAAEEDIGVREDGDLEVLTIREHGTVYGLQIYQEDGMLMEYYGRLDADLPADGAQQIARTKTFEVDQIDEGLFTVTTDAGRTLLHAGRTGGGEAR